MWYIRGAEDGATASSIELGDSSAFVGCRTMVGGCGYGGCRR